MHELAYSSQPAWHDNCLRLEPTSARSTDQRYHLNGLGRCTPASLVGATVLTMNLRKQKPDTLSI